jgi:uncharacterized membrane protein
MLDPRGQENDMAHTPARIAGHPVHPMLVMFPFALWSVALICDLAALAAADGAMWRRLAFVAIVVGLIGALAAAVPGLIDLLSLRSPGTRRIGMVHMVLNVAAVLVFAVNAWLRWGVDEPSGAALALSLVGVALICVAGWLGGEMVYVHGVGVSPAGRAEDDVPAAGAARARTTAGSGRGR